MRLIWIGLTSLMLAACSPQDDSREPAGDDAARAGASEAPRPVTQDAGRQEAVRDRLRELSRDGGERVVDEDAGQSPRERTDSERRARDDRRRSRPERSALRWWKNDDIVAGIGLSDQQVGDIAAARERLSATARQSRRTLAEAASDMRSALAEGNRERLAELVERRVAALDARARAEAEWSKRLFEVLSDDQMKALVQRYPEIAGSLFSPLR
ncbi:MAG: hypothetical protein U5L08_06820 [Xanthomonadales bacterium]|nr:hypothetical protein [Xanthomonadales bacterium]